MARSAAELDEIAAPADFIAFHASGERTVGEFHCSDCGYGIVSRGLLPSCPMCRGLSWERSTSPPVVQQPGML